MSEVVAAAKRVAARPPIVKLSPNVGAIELLARTAEESGADALSLINTFISLAIDARTRRARIGAGFGGLSGPAIKPRPVGEPSSLQAPPVPGRAVGQKRWLG